jgi:magnesium transporter
MSNPREATGRMLSAAFMETHPREAALVLEGLAVADAAAALDSVPPEIAAPVLQEMTLPAGASCLLACEPGQTGEILATLPPDESARLLRGLEAPERARLLAGTPDETRDTLSVLLQYPESTAGALMDPRVLALPEDLTIAEARKRVRRHSRFLRYYLYVTRRDKTLAGAITLRELMLARASFLLSEVAHRPVEHIATGESRKAILAHPAWRRFHAMPVVDERGRLVGVIRYETIRDLEAGRDVQKPQDPVSLAMALGELYWLGATSVTRQLLDALSPTRKDRHEGEK